MGKIPENVIAVINTTTPEELEARGIIQKANKTGYICPICGNGSGDDGTGFTFNFEDGIWKHWCKCGNFEGNNIHLFASYYKLDSTRDFNEICRKACEDLSINDDSQPRPVVESEKPSTELDADELKLIRADIEKARANLQNLPEDARRGLSMETLEHFRCGYIPAWRHPLSILKGKNTPETRRLIIPTSDRHYLASAIERDKVPKDFHKQHSGSKELFNASAINDVIAGKLIYRLIVVEGEIDAMSIWQAFKGGIGVVAVGGVPAGNKLLIELLEARLDDGGGIKIVENELEVVVLFDNDDGGHDGARKLLRELARLNIPAAETYFPDFGGYDGKKIDANQILQDKGADELRTILMRDICSSDSTEAALKAAKADIEARRQQEAEQKNKIDSSVVESESCGSCGSSLTDEQRDLIFNKITGTSDLVNARRFTVVEGDNFRFLADSDRWLLYSDNVWKPSAAGKNYPLIPLVVEAYDKIAAVSTDKAKQKIAAPFANQHKISPMLTFVKGLPSVRVTSADLDQHPNLLNCRNGVIDLETGKFYDHDSNLKKISSLLITQQVNAAYRAGYRNEIVEKFLRDIQPDADDLRALQIFFGYAITGETNVERFLFLKGGGANGKGTFTGAILRLIGSYGTAFPIRGILKSKNADGNTATTALNTLAGKRTGISDEIPKSAKVDLGTLKHLTGGDNVPMRRLHEEFTSVSPSWKLIFSGNDPLLIEDTRDFGFIRRFLYLPFSQTFSGSNANTRLKQQLDTEDCRSGLLTWLIDGAREYYRRGDIYISPVMEEAAKSFLEAQDWLGDFISEHCEYSEGFYITQQDFIKRLKEACNEASKYSRPTLIEMIKKIDGIRYEPRRYYEDAKKRETRIFGIRWREED